MIKKVGNEWGVFTHDGKHLIAKHPSKQGAMKQLQAIEISKHQHEPGATKPKKKQLGG